MALSSKLGITDIGNLKDKAILIRVDFNVPQDKSGNITNPQRFEPYCSEFYLCLSKVGLKLRCPQSNIALRSSLAR
jgi:3-phosphoglycerate kinase